MDLENVTLGYKVPIANPEDKSSLIKCEIISKKTEKGKTMFYIHYLGLNRRYDKWIDGNELVLNNHSEIEIPRKKKKAEDKKPKKETQENPKENGPQNTTKEQSQNGQTKAMIATPDDEFRMRNFEKIQIREYLTNTWYFSPYPKEIIKNGTVFLCEFCLYYFSSQEKLLKHCATCELRHPPGNKIYEEGELSFFEIDGYIQKNYCRNLALLSKLFLDHKSLYWDVDVFMFYVLCRKDEIGYQIVGYFSKEKFSEQGYNLACILTLPFEQRKGYGKILIDFSYLLSKKDKKIAGPEKPLSDLGLLSYRAYWLEVILEELSQSKDITIKGLSLKTHITEEDIIGTLVAYKMIKYYGEDLVIVVNDSMYNKMMKGRNSKVSEEFLLINY